jgi:hypothetical protein
MRRGWHIQSLVRRGDCNRLNRNAVYCGLHLVAGFAPCGSSGTWPNPQRSHRSTTPCRASVSARTVRGPSARSLWSARRNPSILRSRARARTACVSPRRRALLVFAVVERETDEIDSRSADGLIERFCASLSCWLASRRCRAQDDASPPESTDRASDLSVASTFH